MNIARAFFHRMHWSDIPVGCVAYRGGVKGKLKRISKVAPEQARLPTGRVVTVPGYERLWLRRRLPDAVQYPPQRTGPQYMRGATLPHIRPRPAHQWHVQVNKAAEVLQPWPGVLYDAMRVAQEIDRMIRLFEKQPQGLRCGLQVNCVECPLLQNLESGFMTPQQIAEAKAWTCLTHFLVEDGKGWWEQILYTPDDYLHDQRIMESLSEEPDLRDE